MEERRVQELCNDLMFACSPDQKNSGEMIGNCPTPPVKVHISIWTMQPLGWLSFQDMVRALAGKEPELKWLHPSYADEVRRSPPLKIS